MGEMSIANGILVGKSEVKGDRCGWENVIKMDL
jgi:hypothetical protein